MSNSLIVAGPIVAAGGDVPVRWLAVPEGKKVLLREADGPGAAPPFDGPGALLPPTPLSVGPGWGEVRLEVEDEPGGLAARIPPGPAAASVTDVDQSSAIGETPRALPDGRLLRVRHGSPASYRVLAVGGKPGDADALATALALGARAIEALGDDALFAVLLGALARDRSLAWKVADASLRERRDARAPFLAELDDARRERARRAWDLAIHRCLARVGLKTPCPIPDGARDWFFVVRPAVEKIHAIPAGERDAFAVGIARALDALGEEPGSPRFVPLAADGKRERYRLTLARRGEPEYRLFDVARPESGEAVVSGRRVQVASPTQRILSSTCSCGGRLYETDHFCRGCGTSLESLGAMRIHGTFLVGATADVAALCECGGPLGPDDRFCGSCGRSLERA